jgi:hypothetical protein
MTHKTCSPLKVMGDSIPTILAAVYGIAVPDSPRCYLPAASLLQLSHQFLLMELNTGSRGVLGTFAFTLVKCREVARAEEPEEESTLP